jgi:hypothetical protein
MDNAQSDKGISMDKIAHDICGRIFALANALELIRLTAGENPAVAKALNMAERQLKSLNELAFTLSTSSEK